jgi:hypothetical protein
MRLSKENARRLTILLWRERLGRLLAVIAGLVVLAGVFGFALWQQLGRLDPTVAVQDHVGTVVGLETGKGSAAQAVRVHLDDGRDVDATSASRIVLPNGAHVLVAEARHASGQLTYRVLRVPEQ